MDITEMIKSLTEKKEKIERKLEILNEIYADGTELEFAETKPQSASAKVSQKALDANKAIENTTTKIKTEIKGNKKIDTELIGNDTYYGD